MSKEMPKAYEPGKYEGGIYEKWESSGYFDPDNLPGRKGGNYAISMPPPNVTGVLHLGHALENTIMDINTRYQRMKGEKVVLIPGTDHAAIATQAKVEKLLSKEGIADPRKELGREELLKRVREYAEQSKATIINQIKRMGTSCDWSRLAYTLDEDRSSAVNEVFRRMFNDGLIYRGYRVVNWSVKGQSTCSDDELEYKEKKAVLYTFKYSKDFPIAISTTRPETKLGDTAVAVNPNDARYGEYIGKEFTVDVGAKNKLSIRIIADDGVDPNFGTGALGVTPAHSVVDFEMYEKHKLELIQVIGKDGKMNENAGDGYRGLTAAEAREKFAQWLRENDLMEKEEEITHNVGTSDRFNDIVEVLPMAQWFVGVNKEIPGRGKTLKELMRGAVIGGHNGEEEKKINITPERFNDQYLRWIDNLRDWCVSRQIWWGHRIPIFYDLAAPENSEGRVYFKKESLFLAAERKKTDEAGSCVIEGDEVKMCGFGLLAEWIKRGWFSFEQIEASIETIDCRNCRYLQSANERREFEIQDPDTLDTWFSSGLWTFSVLGWPKKTEDMASFHPNAWMQMGYEILFFWMARMILMSTYALDDIPFKDVYIHGILRAKDGRKFSKSLGNGIDPIDMCDQYGTDALRLSLILGNTPGNDARFFEEKIEGARNLVNKLWNVSRYILSAENISKSGNINKEKLTLSDRWILSRLNSLINEGPQSASKHLDGYSFSMSAELLRAFTLDHLADWYIEATKFRAGEQKDSVLYYILKNLLKLWHPFMPFVTEAIWEEMGEEKMLMIEEWPRIELEVDKAEDFDIVKDAITAIRNARSLNKIEPAKKIKAVLRSDKHYDALRNNAALIKGMRTGIEDIAIENKKGEDIPDSIYTVINGIDIYLLGAIDPEKEKARIKKEIDKLIILISNTEKKLANEEFVSKAPQPIVEKEKSNLVQWKEDLFQLEEKMNLF
jgi:valyl-tRNA synthetase